MVRSLRSILPFLLLALIVLIAGCGNKSSGSTVTSSPNPDKIAPAFTTTLITGEKFSYESLKGKPTVLNFAASWCGPCELEAPVLVRGYEKYKDRVQFFGLAVKDDVDSQRAFAEKHGLKFPIGLDPSGKISFDYQKASKVTISGIPTTYFIDADGRIVDFFIGPLSDKTFDQKIAQILPPETATGTGTTPATTGARTSTAPGSTVTSP